MKYAVAGVFALAMAGVAQAQDAELGWTSISTPPGSAAAWTVKPASDATGKPQVIIVMRTAQPGDAPGTDVRASQMVAIDVDCAAAKVKLVSETTFGADFAQTALNPLPNAWTDLAAIGELGGIVRYHCATPNRPVAWQASVTGAQQKLDATLPKPKPPVIPPEGGTFELIGNSDVSYQPYDLWLESDSIKREGNLAKAWVFEAWESGWTPGYRNSSGTWRLYELECVERPRERNIWFQQVYADLTAYNTNENTGDTFSVAGDVNLKAMALRVCNKRPLLFSETIKGSLKTLLSKRYPGASARFAIGVPYASKPAAQPVDLGPTIRLVDRNTYWTYSGTFTRNSNSNSYSGKFEAEGINPLPATLFVRGIVDGKLMIDRIGTPDGAYAFPFSNGKVTGKGVAYWERQNDDYSSTLVEPTTITLK